MKFVASPQMRWWGTGGGGSAGTLSASTPSFRFLLNGLGTVSGAPSEPAWDCRSRGGCETPRLPIWCSPASTGLSRSAGAFAVLTSPPSTGSPRGVRVAKVYRHPETPLESRARSGKSKPPFSDGRCARVTSSPVLPCPPARRPAGRATQQPVGASKALASSSIAQRRRLWAGDRPAPSPAHENGSIITVSVGGRSRIQKRFLDGTRG